MKLNSHKIYDDDGNFVPKIKLSNNPEKVTTPGIKKIVRVYDKETGKIKADLLALEDEVFDENEKLVLYDRSEKWKRMSLKPGTYTLRELLVPVFVDGECVYESPKVMEIREYCKKELDTLWDEHKRLNNPHIVPVDLSDKLDGLKHKLICEMSNLKED